MKNTTQKLIMAAMMAALTCVATMVIRIPSPLHGYINLGDCIVLLAGWLLSPLYGFMAAAIGSALADLLAGFIVYVPVTLFIKGTMALIAYYGYRLISKKAGGPIPRLLSGLTAEVFMILGYFIFEGILYSFGASAVNIPMNALQGAFGLALGILLTKIFEKYKVM